MPISIGLNTPDGAGCSLTAFVVTDDNDYEAP